ncbi:adventurous gliding motility protein CglE, partial [Myxococcota bacterium]|nr:adventurous gliding motility protein CglE [Myxococcota bacterium]
MKSSLLLFGALLSVGVLAPSSAQAQDDDYGDLDSDDDKKKSVQDRVRDRQVREINRGLYLKANVGGAFFLGNFSSAVSAGTATALAVGQDFLDRERTSMAWEIAFQQGVHQGDPYEIQAQTGGPYVQGDLRTYTLAGLFEWNTYPARRWGIGARAGVGVMLSPLPWKLLDDSAIWTQNWSLTPKLSHGPLSSLVSRCTLCQAGCAV